MHSVHSPPNDIEGSPEPFPILPTLQITLLSKNEDPPTGETLIRRGGLFVPFSAAKDQRHGVQDQSGRPTPRGSRSNE